MAAASLFTNAHASLHHLSPTLFRPSQSTTPISFSRRPFALPRCGAAKQTAVELLTAAQERAALRAAESSREEPLFHDPYAACLAAVEKETRNAAAAIEADGNEVGSYELATSFIDEKLMEAVKRDGDTPLRQIVLLSDGMDTRPYRLPWPPASAVFDVSPSATYNVAAERLEGRGSQRLHLIPKPWARGFPEGVYFGMYRWISLRMGIGKMSPGRGIS